MNTDTLYKMFEDEETKREENKKPLFFDKEGVLKLQVGGTYRLRLIPNLNLKQFFVEYEEIAFNSRADGSYQMLGLSPTSPSLGENRIKKDIVSSTQWKSWTAVKDHPDKDVRNEAMALLGKGKRVVNVYVDSDSKDEKNNGQNRVLRMVAGENKKTKVPQGQIWKAIHERLIGEKKERFGPKRLFNLGPQGVTIEITVKEKTIGTKKIPDYVVDFISDSDSPLNLSNDQQEEILSKAYDLTTFIPELKSQSELKQILDEHWNCSGKEGDELEVDSGTPSTDDDDIPTSWNSDDDVPRFDD